MMKLRTSILILLFAVASIVAEIPLAARAQNSAAASGLPSPQTSTPLAAMPPVAQSSAAPGATAPAAPSFTPPTPVPGPYALGPDSQRQPNVPQGVVTKYTWSTSTIYPGTTRDYWIYVPAQYTATKPACVMVFQDGGGMEDPSGGWRVPIVMDNLIAKGDMPVTIGVFINPGVLAALSPDTQQNRFNRSYEYDALGDRYARFLIEEILPEVAKLYNISSDPNDRAIAGSSSGGIAAFNAAWQRPDQFHRVMSFIGSFTNLRGGDELATLIRKTEPKPLRVFLQDGNADQNIYAGSWYLGNQQIFSALQYAGYESDFVTGTEAHNAKQGGAILPDALRWLWKDYPKPVATPTPPAHGAEGASAFLDPASGWELVGEGYKFTDGAAVDKLGNVYFSDRPNNHIYKIDLDGKVSMWREDGEGATGMVFGPDGRMYLCEPARHRIVTIAPDGTETVLAEDIDDPNDLAVLANNDVYFTDSNKRLVWFIDASGNKRVVYTGTDTTGINFPNGVRTSARPIAADDFRHAQQMGLVVPDSAGRLAGGRRAVLSAGDVGRRFAKQWRWHDRRYAGFSVRHDQARRADLRSAGPRGVDPQQAVGRLARQHRLRRARHAMALRDQQGQGFSPAHAAHRHTVVGRVEAAGAAFVSAIIFSGGTRRSARGNKFTRRLVPSRRWARSARACAVRARSTA
jgi:gluconolactonase